MDPFSARAVRAAYGDVAEDYADAFADELSRLPVDRAVLDEAARLVSASSPVLDLGCGPSLVGSYLAGAGLAVVGLDLSREMLEVAKRRVVGGVFTAGDLRSLPIQSASCASAVAFYCIQHIRREALAAVLLEIRRVLLPDGLLVIATHLGQGELIMTQFLGHDIRPAGGTFFAADELVGLLAECSFVVHSRYEREALPNEHPSRRIYLVARPLRR